MTSPIDKIIENLCLLHWTNNQVIRNFRIALVQVRDAEYQNNIVNYDSNFTNLDEHYKFTLFLNILIGVLDIYIYFIQGI